MYRESLVGLALSATLAEISASHALTDSQKKQLWNVFDRCMDICLHETPATSRVLVRSSLPSVPPCVTGSVNGNESTPDRECSTQASLQSCSVTSYGDRSDIHITEDTFEGNTTDNNPCIADVSAYHDEKSCERGASASNTLWGGVAVQQECNTDQSGVIPKTLSTCDMDCTERTVVSDDNISFPVYRCYDGLWTILLKDPTVQVRDEYGVEESVPLDYLKVYIKEDNSSEKMKLTRKRGRPRKL